MSYKLPIMSDHYHKNISKSFQKQPNMFPHTYCLDPVDTDINLKHL